MLVSFYHCVHNDIQQTWRGFKLQSLLMSTACPETSQTLYTCSRLLSNDLVFFPVQNSPDAHLQGANLFPTHLKQKKMGEHRETEAER